MTKVFLDANVIFSSIISASGGSAYIIELAKKKKLKLISSRLALKEVQRNLREKREDSDIIKFYDLLAEIEILLIDTNRLRAKKEHASLMGEKDAPILAAALASKAEFLLTLDKKHFLNSKVAKANLPIKIVPPGEFIKKYL